MHWTCPETSRKPIILKLKSSKKAVKLSDGKGQNVNEFLNGLIWYRCPKTTNVKQETVALATYLAVLKFNGGDISLIVGKKRNN